MSAPTLGWLVLSWMGAHLPNPRDERLPYRPVDWQAARTLRWYELDPSTGRRCWDRVHDEDPKGKGKSPHAAATCICEFRGPVRFVGWAAGGEVYRCSSFGCDCGWTHAFRAGDPMGRPWGSAGLPSPWVQVAAVSEAQTANTWGALHAFLAANDRLLARNLGLEVGHTLVRWKARADALMERVTASAASRTGQPITHALIDEPQEQTPALGGPKLASAIIQNLTKLDGWAHFTGNAPVMGLGSVAEQLSGSGHRVLHIHPRPSVEPREDMTPEELRPLLMEVYEGTPWVPYDRLLDSSQDRAALRWPEFRRLFLNLPDRSDAVDRWMPTDLWDECEADVVFRAELPVHVAVRVAHEHRLAAVAWAQRQGETVVVRVRAFTASDDDRVAADALEAECHGLRARYPARVMGVRRLGKREYLRPFVGPEVAHHGTFFASTAQRLAKAGYAVVDVPDSQARRAQAAEQLMELAINGRFAHDGDPVLAAHIAAVRAVPHERGWKIAAPTEDQPIVAALAAMTAVHQAVTATAPQDRSVGRPRST